MVLKGNALGKQGTGWVEFLLRGVNSAMAILAVCFIIPLFTFFLLFEKKHLAAKLHAAVGSEARFNYLSTEIHRMVIGFFVGNLIVGLATSVAFFVTFLFVKLDNPVGMALFAGFVNLIPILGAFLGGVLPAAQAYFKFGVITPGIVIMCVSIFLHFLINNAVLPKVVGSRINVNTSAAILGLIFWGWMWGAVGIVLGVPLTALVRIGLSVRGDTQPWAALLEEER